MRFTAKENIRLTTIVKDIFRYMGFEINRTTATEYREKMGQVTRYLKEIGFKPKTVIDVGVAYGTDGLYVFPSAQLVLIEPLKKQFQSYIKEIQKKYDAMVVWCGVGHDCGEIEFNLPKEPSGSSLFCIKENFDKDVISVTCQKKTLDVIVMEMDLKGPFLLKLDIEGSELCALQGGHQMLKATPYLILEVSLQSRREGAPELTDVVKFMDDIGYKPFDIFGRRYLEGALMQCDMVFKRGK